jgi:hypothetical protein
MEIQNSFGKSVLISLTLAGGVLAVAQLTPQQLAKESVIGVGHSHNLAFALLMYTSDYDGVLPYVSDTETIKAIIRPYVKVPTGSGANREKDHREVWSTHNPAHSEFLFNTAIGGAMGSNIPRPADTVMLYESKTWQNGTRIVSFQDGHTKRVAKEDWAVASKTLTQKFKRWAKKPLPHSSPEASR